MLAADRDLSALSRPAQQLLLSALNETSSATNLGVRRLAAALLGARLASRAFRHQFQA
jgi:hypothetical protein